jgi:hypothetical protein
MDNDQQIREIFNYKSYLEQAFGIILDEETAAKLWILKYAAIWRLVQNRRADQKIKTLHNWSGSYSVSNESFSQVYWI